MSTQPTWWNKADSAIEREYSRLGRTRCQLLQETPAARNLEFDEAWLERVEASERFSRRLFWAGLLLMCGASFLLGVLIRT